MSRREDRRERREERRERRRARLQGRARLMGIAAQVYEPGDDVEELKLKIAEVLEAEEDDRPWLAFLLELLEILAPILIKVLIGI